MTSASEIGTPRVPFFILFQNGQSFFRVRSISLSISEFRPIPKREHQNLNILVRFRFQQFIYRTQPVSGGFRLGNGEIRALGIGKASSSGFYCTDLREVSVMCFVSLIEKEPYFYKSLVLVYFSTYVDAVYLYLHI